MTIIDPIALAQALVRLNTTGPEACEQPAINLIASLLAEVGFEIATYSFAPGRPSLIARWAGSGSGQPLVFSGHLDTVPIGAAPWTCERRQTHDGVVGGLPMHLVQHDVGLRGGEVAVSVDRRELPRVAKDEHGLTERKEVARQIGIDHRTLVDDDQGSARGGTLRIDAKLRSAATVAADTLDRRVDETVQRRSTRATLLLHDVRGLAGISGEGHLAVDTLGDGLGERDLAGVGEAEEAEDLTTVRFWAAPPRRDGR